MEFTGRLITGDFEENTMTFEIEGEIKLQAGKYKIVQIEAGNQVKNNVGLGIVGKRFSSCSFHEAAILARTIPIDQAEQKLKSYLSGQPITTEVKGNLKVILD
jgi:hypothetical protein